MLKSATAGRNNRTCEFMGVVGLSSCEAMRGTNRPDGRNRGRCVAFAMMAESAARDQAFFMTLPTFFQGNTNRITLSINTKAKEVPYGIGNQECQNE